ncbi:unnamed protein product, partial [Prorocentrum cordatum]
AGGQAARPGLGRQAPGLAGRGGQRGAALRPDARGGLRPLLARDHARRLRDAPEAGQGRRGEARRERRQHQRLASGQLLRGGGRQLCGVPRRLRGGGLHRRAAVQTLLPPRLHREVARGVPPDLPAVLRGLRRRRRQLRRQRASRVFAAVTRRRRRRCRSPGAALQNSTLHGFCNAQA